MSNIEQRRHEQRMDPASTALPITKAHRAAMRSAAGTYASAAFTVLPTQPMHRMSDAALMQATRHRLHLPAHHLLPMRCALCFHTCKTADDRINHAMTCEKLKRKEITSRHDAVLHSLMSECRHAGMLTILEPTTCNQQDRLKPDACIIPSAPTAAQIYLDVSITHAPAKTYVKTLHTDRVDLAAATKRESVKQHKYAAEAKKDGCELIPFVLESTGAFGPSAHAFVRRLAAWSVLAHPSSSYARELARIVAGIACAIQRGNAAIERRVVVAAAGQLTAPGRARMRPAAAQTQAAARPGQLRHAFHTHRARRQVGEAA